MSSNEPNEIKYENYQTNLNQTSSHKFKLMMSKNKENNSKYSYISNSGFSNGIDANILEFNSKTPSNGSKPFNNTVKLEMIRPPGDESNAYYKTQPKHIDDIEQYGSSKWKNMTQKHVFEKDMDDLELDPDEIEDSDHNEEFSVEDRTGIRNYQDISTDAHIYNIPEPQHFMSKHKPPRLDNIDHIGTTAHQTDTSKSNNGYKSHRLIEVKTSKDLKETLGDYIDSSGGTIDAVDILDQNGEPVQEVIHPQTLLNKNYSSLKKLQIGIDKNYSYTSREDSSGKKTKNKLRELTQLTGEN